MMKENGRLREEFATQLQTDVRSIAKEVDAVNMEFTNCLRHAESVCSGLQESTNVYKSHAHSSVNSLRLKINQNTEEVNNKLGEITIEMRSAACSLDECNIRIQNDKKGKVFPLQARCGSEGG